jgi:hypothetical protein
MFPHESWRSPLVEAATRAHELYGITIVDLNEAARQNFPEHVQHKAWLLAVENIVNDVAELIESIDPAIAASFGPPLAAAGPS